MTRRTYVFRDGGIREITPTSPSERDKGIKPMNGTGNGTGFSFQLPKNYKHANRFIEKGPLKGRPYWTSQREAEEISARARDAGEDITWDRGGGLGIA
jgi:hypothetical protein